MVDHVADLLVEDFKALVAGAVQEVIQGVSEEDLAEPALQPADIPSYHMPLSRRMGDMTDDDFALFVKEVVAQSLQELQSGTRSPVPAPGGPQYKVPLSRLVCDMNVDDCKLLTEEAVRQALQGQ